MIKIINDPEIDEQIIAKKQIISTIYKQCIPVFLGILAKSNYKISIAERIALIQVFFNENICNRNIEQIKAIIEDRGFEKISNMFRAYIILKISK